MPNNYIVTQLGWPKEAVVLFPQWLWTHISGDAHPGTSAGSDRQGLGGENPPAPNPFK